MASTAASMTWMAAFGRVTSERCPALTVEISAPAWVDIACCCAGGMTLSAVPISDHEGIASHAGGPDASKNWLSAAGRWAAKSSAAWFRSTPLAKHSS